MIVIIRKIIKALRSARLALGLILFISVLGLIGIAVPQVPAAYAAPEQAYAWWVDNVAYERLGTVVYTLEPLGFLHIFRSAWFLGASALLVLNILMCTAARVRALRLGSERPKTQPEPEFYQEGKSVCEFEAALPLQKTGEAAASALEDRNYSVEKTEGGGIVCLAGGKRRYSSWGTLLVHLSLILMIVGVLAGVLFGFHDESFTVAEGTTKELGYQTGLSVRLDAFTDTYWDNGMPKDYRSDVEILKDGSVVRSGTIRVNHPLTVDGVRILQSSFGQAVQLRISDAAGETIFVDTVPLTGINQNDSVQRNVGEATLPDNRYHVVLLSSAINGTDPIIAENQIGVEFYDQDMNFLGWLLLDQNKPQKLGDLTFAFDNLQYAGFVITKEPGTGFIWLSAALFLLGLGMIFYLPSRKIWIRLVPASENSTRVYAKLESPSEFGLEKEALSLFGALGLRKTDGS